MNKQQISKLAAALGKLGGSVKSKTKAAAARKNGKLGGRPRKIVTKLLGIEQTKELFGDLLEVNP